MTGAVAALAVTQERQQTAFLPPREQRFEVITRTLGALVDTAHAVVLDLGCGPGSLSRRILAAHPAKTGVAVDSGSVLLAIGRPPAAGTVFDSGGSRRICAPRTGRSTRRAIGPTLWSARPHSTGSPTGAFPFDRQVHALLRPGGVPLNGNNLPSIRLSPGCSA